MTAPTHDPWAGVSAAQLPQEHLAALAAVRNFADVRVLLEDGVAWVCWPAGRGEVVRCLLPVPGVVFYSQRAGAWARFGHLVPTDDAPPATEGKPIAEVLVPARFEQIPLNTALPAPVVLTVVRGGSPKPATALICTIAELAEWADTATTAELARVRGARTGDRVALIGEQLPTILRAKRFWGRDVFVPVGFRPEPNLPTPALLAATGTTPKEFLFLDETGADVIPRGAFEPLTRAGVRLGVSER